MSLRSIERRLQRFTHRARIYVGTAHVAVDILAGWGRRRVRSTRIPVGADAGFDAALQALAKGLQEAVAPDGDLRGQACSVVLADAWMLYDVVPLDVMQVSSGSAASIVAAALADIAGARPRTLEVQWQWQRGGHSAFAMAIARDRLARLRTLLAQHGLAVKSVTGEFVAVYRAHRRTMTAPRIVFALDRDAGAQIALVDQGAIRAMRFEVGRADPVDLSRAATRLMRTLGDDTTAPIHYVLDSDRPNRGGERDHVGQAGAWSALCPPPWMDLEEARA